MSYHNNSSSQSTPSPTTSPVDAQVVIGQPIEQIARASISGFEIDTSDAPQVAQNRNFIVSGDVGAKFFMVVIKDGSQKYYNFVDGTFDDGHSAKSNLHVTLSKSQYRGTILLPSGGGNFVLKVIALQGTTILNGKKVAITKSIFKAGANITVTFSPFSGVANAYTTFSTFTSVGYTQAITTPFSLTVTNTKTEANGFGLISQVLNGILKASVITEENFFYKVTGTVNGTVSSSTTVVVDNLLGIIVGTQIHGVSSGSLSGTPSITAIDVITKTLTLSSAQSFANDITLTFRSYGQNNIQLASGVGFSVSRYPTFRPGAFTIAKVRQQSSSGTVGLVSTYGVAAGADISGRGIALRTTINAVTQADIGDGEDGVATITDTSVVILPGEGFIVNTFVTADISGTTIVNSFPSENKTIFLDLDSVITVGEATT